jgi:AraC-like DNA-binding protein
MRQGQDFAASFPGILIVHQKIRGNAVGQHRHDEHELFLPLQGEIRIRTEEDWLKAGPGKMIYLPPGVKHLFQATPSGPGERLILIVEDKLWKASGGGTFPPSLAADSQLCKELLFHLLIHPKTKAARPLVDTLIQTASEMLEASGLQSFGGVAHLYGRASDPRVKGALMIIQEKFDRPLSMSELARGAGLSTRNLNRLFLSELGVTPKQAVTLHRIEMAKKLLSRGRESVTDIAFQVGYSSVSQFITTFRRITGQVPSRFSER